MESKRLIGFTLVEVMITVSILGVMAAVIAFNAEFTQQSAKHEAEKVVMYIQNLMKKSDRIHTSFDIDVKDKVIVASWENHGTRKESFDATPSCSYTPSAEIMIYDRDNFTDKSQVVVDETDFYYKDSSNNNKVYEYYIEVTDSSGEKCYVGIIKNQ